MRYFSALLLVAFLLMPFMATAQDKNAGDAPKQETAAEETAENAEDAEEDEGFLYSPEHCEFDVTFPGAPYTTRRCEDPEKKTRCFDMISYTQVYELSATVNFRIICNPVDESLYKEYSAEVMEATLRAMTKNSVVSEFNSGFREEEGYKQAGLAGSGKVGRMPTIYIAQLWIGKQSALSVEAELIGNAHQAADTLFGDILKSIEYSGIKDLEEPRKTTPPRGN